jgi:hypothetical protein
VPWSSLTVAGSTCFECGAREGGSSVEKAPESSTERRFTVQRSTDGGGRRVQQATTLSCGGLREGEEK